MSEVVRLHGNEPVYHPGKPDMRVVKELEDLMERARSGEIVGLVYAAQYHDGGSCGDHVGDVSRNVAGRLFAELMSITDIMNKAG